ncbi:CopG family ribbon-helix-helix protein [Candidatus Nanohalovita haloferacivicina]|uniref:CopG family ribbon-helix-helix protein n=1 Tax=Candidatus Nanohalovita haloferacivicina TaxID=2978046 RepID=UPI00325FB126|nr:Transcriptional regulator, CopG/Arc/MetJ family (DNA-binding and a metal-binding domains) [Candidatus Nanohalobia archaeon BNXNv]
MEIISLSLDEETLEKIEEINEEGSFNGRSELIRKAIERLHRETMENSNLEGELNAVVVARHPHRKEQEIAKISHDYDHVITTQLHSKLSGDKCLEVFHTMGLASEVIEFYNELEGSKHTDSVTMLPQDQ